MTHQCHVGCNYIVAHDDGHDEAEAEPEADGSELHLSRVHPSSDS